MAFFPSKLSWLRNKYWRLVTLKGKTKINVNSWPTGLKYKFGCEIATKGSEQLWTCLLANLFFTDISSINSPRVIMAAQITSGCRYYHFRHVSGQSPRLWINQQLAGSQGSYQMQRMSRGLMEAPLSTQKYHQCKSKIWKTGSWLLLRLMLWAFPTSLT